MALPHANAGQVVDLHPLGTGLKQARTVAIVKSEFPASDPVAVSDPSTGIRIQPRRGFGT